jgi:peptidoglycan biosynthesis protein MviN/MurJ (putative lipid II flippase)
VFVAGGIMLSRLAGLVRQRALSHYLGLGPEADAFAAAFRIPNLLQNLFGEGALSAAFIPVYARRLGAEDHESARRVAGAVLSWLALILSVVVLAGVAGAPLLVNFLAPGFTVRLARSPSRWCACCFQARGCWSSRRGASEFSTATGASSSPTRRRSRGTWRSSSPCWSRVRP